MKAPNPPKAHHYIPQAILRKWAVNDGMLWRFTRPYGAKIDAKLVPPSAVGFEHFLYETPGIPAEHAQQLETGFMQRMDAAASRALDMLLSDEVHQWKSLERSAWTRFISSLWFRTPENVKAFKDAVAALILKDDPQFEESYRREKPDGWPDTFAEALQTHLPQFAEQAAMQILPRIIDDQSRGERFNNMIWSACEVRGSDTFLISDAPLVMTSGIGGPNDYLIMPLSPTRLFVAVNEQRMIDVINTLPANEIVRRVNESVVCHASIFVGSVNLTKREYIEKNFNSIEHDTFAKKLARRYQAGDF